MDTLSVWKFDTASGAEDAQRILLALQAEELINIHDAAVVSWQEGKRKPKTRQLNDQAGFGALGGGFWGLLFGLIFFVPLIGAAVGAAVGALSASLVDVGIDDSFIKSVRDKVVPGTSALFLLSSGAVTDRVKDAFTGTSAELISTNLSKDEEAKLRAVFAED